MRHGQMPSGIVTSAQTADEPSAGESSAEQGFTLIELMVVLLVMGILMAIAIPSFLSATNAANDRSAQSNLTNAVLSVKNLYAQTGTYPSTAELLADVSKSEPELTFTTGASSGVDDLSLYSAETATIPDATLAYLAVWVPSTKICWVAEDTAASAGVRYGYTSYSSTGTATPQAQCTATLVPTKITTPGSGWKVAFPVAPAGH